jgi:hypothetical protein
MSKNYYQIVVNESDFQKVLWDKHVQDNWKPVNKCFWESQEKFDKRRSAWDIEHTKSVYAIVDMYKRDFPEMYEVFELNNYGFSRGNEKTFFLWVSKYEPNEEEGEEHA